MSKKIEETEEEVSWAEVFDYCPCDTCINEGNPKRKKCDMGHKEPFTSRSKTACGDWDEGEIEDGY
jgi:hypothetical protein